MKEEIKQRLEKPDIWHLLFYMIFFIFIYGFSKFIVLGVMLFQFLSFILTGKTNEQLLKFGQNLSTYVYQITIFLTFNSNQRPFPFSEWPKIDHPQNDQY